MIYCRVENCVVTNRAVFDGPMPDGWAEKDTLWIENEVAQIGWAYGGKGFTAPPREPDPEPVPRLEDPTTKRFASLEAALALIAEKAGVTVTAEEVDARTAELAAVSEAVR